MSVRTPIQVPEELRDQIDTLRDKLWVKTNYQVIEKLVAYYERGERQKIEDREKAEAEKRKQQQTMVFLGPELKGRYTELSKSLGFRSEWALFDFLLDHFERTVDKPLLEHYARLLK